MISPRKKGYIKCRLIHREGVSFIQPDVLFGSRISREFFIPFFFSPNQIGIFGEDEIQCRIAVDLSNESRVMVAFSNQDHLISFQDGSMIYRCSYSIIRGNSFPKPSGKWRLSRSSEFQMRLFHHTNDDGFNGITRTQSIWGSRRNIQGNLLFKDIAHGYFTNLSKIRNEADLQLVAMSRSGLTSLLPINAPLSIADAVLVGVPVQEAIDRARSMAFWISVDMLEPSNLWFKAPINEFPYYEVIYPNIFRVGLQPDKSIAIVNQEVRVPESDRKQFGYIIVGDGDDHEGLVSAVREETSEQRALVECPPEGIDILSFWQRNANTDLYTGREPEALAFEAEGPSDPEC